ncbi:alanine/ornithine racemase family PLP-dependent enzyme [uncultured Shimia sp.]|uniref:alanine/ornithine racemase family PLP-dependent enzyme n=1 Tax=uncultured Shimia sp. TaxID=573152 RepID=UPI002616F550|nr:alanine/ornithine racemase family PLP-dependent enzyme [uncultured Shimia sp.]
MNAPRIEVDLAKIRHNTQSLVKRLEPLGIAVLGVTKAVCGNAAIAQAMIDGGVLGLADARISNVGKLRKSGIKAPITLIRTPMLSQVEQVVSICEVSCNTELSVIAGLSAAAVRTQKTHGVILMVEMGDMREGISPDHLGVIAKEVDGMPGVSLKGIGANFACLGGPVPDATQMAKLSKLAMSIDRRREAPLEIVSGGNSANLPWAMGQSHIGRINELRLGEAILLGVNPVSGKQISGLYTDAFVLIAEVIETKTNPASVADRSPCFGARHLVAQNSPNARSILALGVQDTDLSGLTMPVRIRFVGATSDHTIITNPKSYLHVGNEVKFYMNYGALMRAMAAPNIAIRLLGDAPLLKSISTKHSRSSLTLV